MGKSTRKGFLGKNRKISKSRGNGRKMPVYILHEKK